jgi:hypothetical protein
MSENMENTYTAFLQNSLSHMLRLANRIRSGLGQGDTALSVTQLQELKRECDEVSDILTALIACKCGVEALSSGNLVVATIGDKSRTLPAPKARKWIVRALCGRRR